MAELGTVDPQTWVRFPPTAPYSNKPCGLKNARRKKYEKNKTRNKNKGG